MTDRPEEARTGRGSPPEPIPPGRVPCACGCGRPGRTPAAKLKPGQNTFATDRCDYTFRNKRHYVPVGKRSPEAKERKPRAKARHPLKVTMERIDRHCREYSFSARETSALVTAYGALMRQLEKLRDRP